MLKRMEHIGNVSLFLGYVLKTNNYKPSHYITSTTKKVEILFTAIGDTEKEYLVASSS